MAKHIRHSDAKHPDKFIESLAGLWHKSERYVIRAGIVMIAVIVIAGAWLALSSLFAGRSERPWEERFQLAEFAAKAQEGPEGIGPSLFEKMKDFAQRHQGTPAAAITLLELAEAENRRAEALASNQPKDSRAAYERAAAAAEQFIADFPAHPEAALGYYAAARARMGLGEWERAAEHFERAARSPVLALGALAKLQAGYCYERLGRVAQARLKYEELRAERLAGWCADQAEFALAQLGRGAPQEPGQKAATPQPPTPSK